MRDYDRRFADEMARLDRAFGCAIRQRDDTPSQAEQAAFLGEDSALLKGLLAGMTFAGAPGRRR